MHKHQSGFSIIELVIVMTTLGLLGAVAVPKFIDVTKKAEAASVKDVLGSVRSALSAKVAKGLANGEDITAWKYDGSAALNPMTDLLTDYPDNFIGLKTTNTSSDETGKWWDRSFRSNDHWVMYKLKSTSLISGGWENAGINLINRIVEINNENGELMGLSLNPGSYTYTWND